MVWTKQKCLDVLRHRHGCSDPIYADRCKVGENKMGQKLIDMTGQRFGRLFVVERDLSVRKNAMWKCICDCGNETVVSGINLRSGNTKSCGCLKLEYEDLSGMQFGDLTVLHRDMERVPKVYYICRCKCGELTSVRSDGLTGDKVHSCGCSVDSTGSRKIKQLLIDNNVEFKPEVWFDDLKSPRGGYLRYDFGIMQGGEICRLIEFDGRQHFESIGGWWGGDDALQYRKECDAMKDEYARQHNIPLIRISYKDENKITLSMLLGKTNELLSA